MIAATLSEGTSIGRLTYHGKLYEHVKHIYELCLLINASMALSVHLHFIIFFLGKKVACNSINIYVCFFIQYYKCYMSSLLAWWAPSQMTYKNLAVSNKGFNVQLIYTIYWLLSMLLLFFPSNVFVAFVVFRKTENSRSRRQSRTWGGTKSKSNPLNSSTIIVFLAFKMIVS